MSAERFHTVTSNPFFTRFMAMPLPMMPPAPMKPSLTMISTQLQAYVEPAQRGNRGLEAAAPA